MKTCTPGSSMLLLTLLVLTNTSYGQRDTIPVGENFTHHAFPSGLSYFESKQIAPDSAWRTFKGHSPVVKKLEDDNLGIVSGYFWFSVSIKNTTARHQRLYYVVEHSHLRRLCFYEAVNDTVKLKSETGYQFSFLERAVPHRYFIFPLELSPHETKTLILLVDQENSLNLPMSLWNQDSFHQRDYVLNLLFGLGLGFVLFCAIFSLIGAILLRQQLFVWYFLYLLSVLFYGFTEPGFSIQFLFPTLTNFGGPLSIHAPIYTFIFLIKFSQALLNTKKSLPLPHRILNFIFYLMIGMVLADWALGETLRTYSFYYLPVVFGVMIVGLVLLVFCGIRTLKINRPIASLYLSASGMVLMSGLISIPNTVYGLSVTFRLNPVLLGYLFEVFFLSFALIIQYRQLQRERTALAAQLAEQQQQMYKNYIEGIEKERSRIAGELHDDIGARLSNIKQIVGIHQENVEETKQKIDNLIDDIRRLSHDLALPVAHVSGLRPLVEQLIGDVRKNSTIDFRLNCYDFVERFSATEIQQLYRILQEAIHNIVSHAQATMADIQLFGYENEIVIVIEDDGKGFEIAEKINGIGLNQMRIRTESLGGRIEINSKPGMGTHILIEMPFKRTSQ